MTKWIGVDLDRTLAHYDTWKGEHHIGEPIQPMVDRIKEWLSKGFEVRIFTARVDVGITGVENSERYRDIENVKRHIREWCVKHLGFTLPITNTKDYGMLELWDDRAVHVEPNTGKSHHELIDEAYDRGFREGYLLHADEMRGLV